MRVVVTGTSGFVGRALCALLAARGHDVAALDRAATGDLVRFADWPRALSGADAVVHLAALAHAAGVSGERLRAVNVDAAVSLGNAAARAGTRMIFMSSIKVHGEETPGAPFAESSPFAPRDAYGKAKAAAETALQSIPGLDLAVLRPPLVYGPGVRANFLALMRAIAAGLPLPFAGIANRRSLVYVENLADAIARVLECADCAGKAWLVSDGAPVSTPELCRALGRALGRPARLFSLPRALLEAAPPMRKLTRSLEVSDRAIRESLGWAPPFSFEEGIRRTARWFRARDR